MKQTVSIVIYKKRPGNLREQTERKRLKKSNIKIFQPKVCAHTHKLYIKKTRAHGGKYEEYISVL